MVNRCPRCEECVPCGCRQRDDAAKDARIRELEAEVAKLQSALDRVPECGLCGEAPCLGAEGKPMARDNEERKGLERHHPEDKGPSWYYWQDDPDYGY